MTTTPEPHWIWEPVDSFAELVEDVAAEGTSRLLLQPTKPQREQITAFLTAKGLNFQERDDIDSFTFSLMIEAIAMAAILGYALALTPQGLDDFETWLRHAIARAGLGNYEIKSKLEHLHKAVQP